MRNDDWLENRFDKIMKKHFSDVEAPNSVFIKWGRRARTRLGSIRKVYPKSILKRLAGDFETQIIINSHFKDEKIPSYVVDATIGHELCHYAHGFSSPLPQATMHPHKGGIVTREMKNRGMGNTLSLQKKWLKQNWQKYIKNN